MNKKAQEEGISITFSIIFLTVVLLLFWIFSFIDKGVIREETSDQIEINNININLLNLLRTEIDNLTISDLIVKSYNEKDYTILNTEVNSLFENYFDKDYCWTLSILDNGLAKKKIHDVCGGKQINSEVKIPTLDSKDLTIRLSRYSLEHKLSYPKGVS